MTKRILLALLCLSLLILSGCTESTLSDISAELKDIASSLRIPESILPTLSPVDNTAENLTLMDALGQNRQHESRMFDFTAPDGMKKVVITQWEWVDGQWHNPGSRTLGLSEAQGRLGLNWTTLCEPVGIVVRTGGQTFAVSRDVPEQEHPTGEQMVTIFQSMEVEIILEEDIPLVMQIITNTQDPPVIPLECWQEPERYAGHVDVRLVTVRFSADPMETEAPLLV